MNPLRHVSTDDLLEELIRRRNEGGSDEPPRHWCHDCAHFVAWNDDPKRGAMPDDYNPCTKGHKMLFRMPDDIGDEYGFFMRVCGDRSMPPEPPEEQPRKIPPAPKRVRPAVVR